LTSFDDLKNKSEIFCATAVILKCISLFGQRFGLIRKSNNEAAFKIAFQPKSSVKHPLNAAWHKQKETLSQGWTYNV